MLTDFSQDSRVSHSSLGTPGSFVGGHEGADDEENSEENSQEMEFTPNSVEKLCLAFEQNPTNEELKLKVLHVLKKLYIKTGGSPIITTSPIPSNLSNLTPTEMINAVDNQLIKLNTSRKTDIVSKCFNIFNNVTNWIAEIIHLPIRVEMLASVKEDYVLRESLVSVFMGKNVKPSSSTTLFVSIFSHLSNTLPHGKLSIGNNNKKSRSDGRDKDEDS